MLKNSKIVGFAATAMPDKSKHFYREILGLTLVEETPFALVFDSNGTAVRIQITEQVLTPPYTTLGWAVEDILVIE